MGLSRNPLVKLGDPNIPNQMRLNGHSIISGECHQTLPRPSRCQSSLFQVIAPAWTQWQVRGPCSLLFHLGASSKYVVFWCSLVWQSNLSSWKRHNNWGPVASFGLPSSLDPSCPRWQGLWGCIHWLKRKITRSRWEPSIDPQVWGWERWTGHFIMAVGIWGFEDECSYFSRCKSANVRPSTKHHLSFNAAYLHYITFRCTYSLLSIPLFCNFLWYQWYQWYLMAGPMSPWCPHGGPMVAIAKRSAPAIAPHGLRPPGRKAHEDAAAWIGGTKNHWLSLVDVDFMCLSYVFGYDNH